MPSSIVNNMPPQPDDISRRARDAERQAREQASARSGQAMQIGAGGITVTNGGSITIQGTGSLHVGSGALDSAGSITAADDITAGGNVTGAGLVSTGSASVAGGLSCGALSASDIATLNPGIVSSDVKSRVLAVNYDSVYIDVNNRLGLSPSSRRFKQDIGDETIDTTTIDRMQPRHFRLIGAVEALGDDAKVELGFIAEEIDEIGLGAFVTRDNDGEIAGIAYDRLTVPLVAAVKELRADVRALQARLAAAGIA